MTEPGFDAVWKALADPTRRRILDLLKDRPRTTGDLCTAFSLSRFAVMKHLGVLEDAGLVVVRRNGRERWNHLNAVPLRRIYEHYIDPVSDHLATSLLRLADATKGPEQHEPHGRTQHPHDVDRTRDYALRSGAARLPRDHRRDGQLVEPAHLPRTDEGRPRAAGRRARLRNA